MQIVICKDVAEVAKTAASMVAKLVRAKPNCVLGFATGSTPVETYKRLVGMHKEEGLSFAKVCSFNLDEYYPIEPNHEQSYRYFMNRYLFDHIDIEEDCTNVPNGRKQRDLEAIKRICVDYEYRIEKLGGIDLQILGIGSTGHIAFNELGSSFASRTRLVVLTERTIMDNSRFFDRMEDVPKYAISMGIGTILETRHAILLATGRYKAEAIARAIEGPITSSCPASALQLHKRATFIVDEAAAGALERKKYYQHTQKLLRDLEQGGKGAS